MTKWLALPLMTTMVLMGISGCANPADDVAPATVSAAKPVSPATDSPAKPGPEGGQLKSLSQPAPVLAPGSGSASTQFKKQPKPNARPEPEMLDEVEEPAVV